MGKKSSVLIPVSHCKCNLFIMGTDRWGHSRKSNNEWSVRSLSSPSPWMFFFLWPCLLTIRIYLSTLCPASESSSRSGCQCLFARTVLQCPGDEWVQDLLSFQRWSRFTTAMWSSLRCSSLPGGLSFLKKVFQGTVSQNRHSVPHHTVWFLPSKKTGTCKSLPRDCTRLAPVLQQSASSSMSQASQVCPLLE